MGSYLLFTTFIRKQIHRRRLNTLFNKMCRIKHHSIKWVAANGPDKAKRLIAYTTYSILLILLIVKLLILLIVFCFTLRETVISKLWIMLKVWPVNAYSWMYQQSDISFCYDVPLKPCSGFLQHLLYLVTDL